MESAYPLVSRWGGNFVGNNLQNNCPMLQFNLKSNLGLMRQIQVSWGRTHPPPLPKFLTDLWPDTYGIILSSALFSPLSQNWAKKKKKHLNQGCCSLFLISIHKRCSFPLFQITLFLENPTVLPHLQYFSCQKRHGQLEPHLDIYIKRPAASSGTGF